MVWLVQGTRADAIADVCLPSARHDTNRWCAASHAQPSGPGFRLRLRLLHVLTLCSSLTLWASVGARRVLAGVALFVFAED